jgi:hypothetical protein
MYRREIVLSMSTAVAFALSGCDRPAPDEANSELNVSLLRYLQLAGVECSIVLGSQVLNDESTAWRVTCAENRTHLASVESDGGQICVTAMPYIEAPVSNARPQVDGGRELADRYRQPSPLPAQSNPAQSQETSRCVPYSVG